MGLSYWDLGAGITSSTHLAFLHGLSYTKLGITWLAILRWCDGVESLLHTILHLTKDPLFVVWHRPGLQDVLHPGTLYIEDYADTLIRKVRPKLSVHCLQYIFNLCPHHVILKGDFLRR